MLLLLAVSVLLAVPQAQTAGDTLTAMTYNVRYGTAPDGPNAWPLRRDALVETIRAHDPDVFGVQECLRFQADYLQTLLPEYRWIGIGRDADGGGEMTAIFYRDGALVPVASGHQWLSETPDVPGSLSWDAAYPRTMSWARFHLPESRRILSVVNTHLDHLGVEARAQSASLIAGHLAGASADAVVLLGDFNTAGGSAPWQTLAAAGLLDAWEQAAERVGPVATWADYKPPAPDPALRIDWILYGGALDPVRAEHVMPADTTRFPSDHLPVVARFRWRTSDGAAH
jgi:endonuclease/exonuclease/phosphatase family metal-dependent hydrolase